jgi:type III restriction enzyme
MAAVAPKASGPASLIINSPYVEPLSHWVEPQPNTALEIKEERRPAGYEIFDPRHNTRRVIALDRVNEIRKRLAAWQAAGRPGITSVTRALIDHWHDQEARQYPFYFCQLEAIETLIWWAEAPADFKQGVVIPGDGGEWGRLCNKMATGTGKTTVMAMLIAWQTLNALTYPKRKDFSSAFLIVTPGLTVKERLQVLQPGHPENYYDAFAVCPSESLRQRLNSAEILIENWHTLMPLEDQTRSVVRKGAESDEAFTRRVLGSLASRKDLIVINDEAHHAYRVPADVKIGKVEAAERGLDLDEATRWIEGLDRIHKTRRIRQCYDLSATPFAPTGKKTTTEALFEWIVSDFGLNDAIEAGLVKTPRVVVRDSALPEAKTMRSKLYHLYNEAEIREDLNRKAEPEESLPDLVQKAYHLLATDWLETLRDWRGAEHKIPPVMLTVCNRTETAARVERFFLQGDCIVQEMKHAGRTLRVDSKVLDKAEVGETATADKNYEKRLHEIIDAADLSETRKQKLEGLKKEQVLREIVDTVGKRDRAGQGLQNVISVAMLSEGWDAKNVTHIMGLRAFTSQLLCEQVIGRGLRRVAHEMDENGLFLPEFVNIFGVPLSIFQVGDEGNPPPPPKPSTLIESLPARSMMEIKWPNIERIDTVLRSKLTVDWDKVEVLEIDPGTTPMSAEMAAALGGQTDLGKLTEIDILKFEEQFRLQRLLFQGARKAFEQFGEKRFSGDASVLFLQLVKLVEEFWRSKKIHIPSLFHQDDLRRRVLFALNIDRTVQHLFRHLRQQNLETLEPVFNTDHPIGSTAQMRSWHTTKSCYPSVKSQISHVVYDSTWEATETYAIEKSPLVEAFAKNDHLGFQMLYLWNGSKRKFFPDFLIRLKNGTMLILEVKGEDSPQNKAKRAALDEWIQCVNTHGGFGRWAADVSFNPSDIHGILAKAGK